MLYPLRVRVRLPYLVKQFTSTNHLKVWLWLFSARSGWLFLLELCCVSGTVTAVSSANVISCSVGCESISFPGTITEDCRFFFPIFPIITFESNHCALLNIQCQNQNTSAAQCCDRVILMSITSCFQVKSSCLQTTMFVSVSFNLKPLQNIPSSFFYTRLWVSKYHSWP